jgi:alkyl hydroperoxide reductase subunit AhpC
MIHDIRLSKDQPIDEAALEEEAVKSAKYSWFLYIPSDFYFVCFSEYLEMSVRIV